ncbi:MAG: hypothetical protein E3J86_04125 [Candidatus Thorarchaeota archaeon]|nr:MAG: hypothetical protein E3J86_04125 [Candidatus Thorarchaeota archaeon]
MVKPRIICSICFITLISFALVPSITITEHENIGFDSGGETELAPQTNPLELVPIKSFTESFSNVEMSWTSRDDDVRRVFGSPVATGDHVILHVDAYDQLIETSLLDFSPSFSLSDYLVIAEDGYNPYFDFDINPEDGNMNWFSFTGIQRGQIVTIVGLFSNSDCDFMAWTGDTDPLSYADNILGASMTTTANPEGVSFVWDSNSPELILACYNCDDSEGWVEILVFLDSTVDKSVDGNYITFHTYSFQENLTVPVLYMGFTDGLLLTTVFHPGLTFNNYFAPNITQFPPVELGSNQFNLTWRCTDRNQDDTNYYSVWLSSDGGVSYQRIVGNITESFFVWNSSGFLEREDYLVKIRAYSLDFTYPELCSVDNPPSSYWPGDYSDSEPFEIGAGDVHSGGPTITAPSPYTIIVYSQPDITYTFGTTGNQITWTHSYPAAALYYVVTIDGNLYQSGHSSNRVIIVSIDGLSIGDYEFEVVVESSASDSVIVHVIPTSEESSLRTGLLTGISAGSAIIIILSMVLINRIVRRSLREKSLELLARTNSTPLSILELEREDS